MVTSARELPDSPVHGVIEFARTLVGQPERARDLEVMFETIDSLLEREIEAMPRSPASDYERRTFGWTRTPRW